MGAASPFGPHSLDSLRVSVQSFTLSELELNGDLVEMIGHGDLTVNVQYLSSKVPGLQGWVIMAVLDGSQAHRFLPPDQPLAMRTRTGDGRELSGQVYPHKVDDNGSSTTVELQGSGNLDGYEAEPNT